MVTWVVVEVERVSAVALNMLVSTSFPAEPLEICGTESSGVSGAGAGEPPELAPEELGPSHWDAPTQPSAGGESAAREKKRHCAVLPTGPSFFEGDRERFPQLPQAQSCRRGPLHWGDDFMAAFRSSPPILSITLSAQLSGHL